MPPRLVPPSTYPPPAPPAPVKRGRGVLIGSLIAALVAVIAAGTAIYIVLNNGKAPEQPSQQTQPASHVTIAVRDDRVTLTWTDPSNGVAQPIIVGFRESEGLRRFAVPAKGSTEVVIPGLNKNYDYCFMVVLVYSEQDLKQSEQVCTERKKASPSPTR
jgi:hypothetical protein